MEEFTIYTPVEMISANNIHRRTNPVFVDENPMPLIIWDRIPIFKKWYKEGDNNKKIFWESWKSIQKGEKIVGFKMSNGQPQYGYDLFWF